MSPDDLLPFEEDLSAYLDGELDAEREAAVRAELERNPRLAARLEALRSVDVGLSAASVPPVPADLRARLQARIDAEGAAKSPASAAPAAPASVMPAPRTRRVAPARRRRWVSPPAIAAVAVAAAVALVLLVRRPVEDLPPERVAEERAPEAPPPSLDEITAAPPEPPVEIAAPGPGRESIEPPSLQPGPEAIESPSLPPVRESIESPSLQPGTVPTIVAEAADPQPATVDLAAVGDEELEIAMEWDLLDEDLEMIEQLELLEAMLAMERGQG